MEGRGIAHMGVGIGEGENKIDDAVKNAVESPLLETSIKGAKSILLYVAGGYDMGMLDISTIADRIQQEADPDANIIFGAKIDEEMQGKIQVTIVATDFASAGIEVVAEPAEKPAEPMGTPTKVNGIDAYEVELDQLMASADNTPGPSINYEIPDFLK